MVECSFTNEVIVGSNPLAAKFNTDIILSSIKNTVTSEPFNPILQPITQKIRVAIYEKNVW